MKHVLTGSQMKACDQETIAYYGVSSPVLMERAALACVDMLMQHFDVSADKAAAGSGGNEENESGVRRPARILALCGSGNNGGDGVAIARILKERGIGCDLCMAGVDAAGNAGPNRKADADGGVCWTDIREEKIAAIYEEKLSADCLRQYETAMKYGVSQIGCEEALSRLAGKDYDVVIDAMFGVGLSRPLNERYINIVRAVNESGARVLAVDLPTGIHADSGAVMGDAVRAEVTATFAFYKRGQLLYPGRDYCGSCIVADIGITKASLPGRVQGRMQGAQEEGCRPPEAEETVRAKEEAEQNELVSFCLESADLARLPARSNASNKGTYGKALLVAGSREICGAAYLSGAAAYKTGAGLVQILSEETNRTALQTMLPEALLTFYSEKQADTGISDGRQRAGKEKQTPKEQKEALQKLTRTLDWASVAAIGPGLGKSDTARLLLRETLAECGVSGKPLVIDADGLNLLAEDMTLLSDCHAPVIVTPHMAEMSRLTGTAVAELKNDPVGYAAAFAKKYHVVCVLKDACTVVCDGKDGICLNTSGNNGMSTGGAGDVLTGVITGLLAQHMEPFAAACMGVYLHGLAGDMAAQDTGVYGLTASALLAGLRALLKTVRT